MSTVGRRIGSETHRLGVARVLIEGGALIVRMGSLERFQTMTARFEAPLQHVIGVDTGRAKSAFVGSFISGSGFGIGAGVRIPFLPFGGRFSTENGRMLIAFRDPSKCITISLKDESYDKVVVQVDDKDQVAAKISTAMALVSEAG